MTRYKRSFRFSPIRDTVRFWLPDAAEEELANNGNILDRLLEHTGPEVKLVLDIAWAHIAGFSPEILM